MRAKNERGVRVRVICDSTAYHSRYQKCEMLRDAGLEVRVENWGGKLHTKYAVFDNEALVFGSMNWGGQGFKHNNENTLIIKNNQTLMEKFTDFFNSMWNSLETGEACKNAGPKPESLNSIQSCEDGIYNDFDGLVDNSDPDCQISQ
ncbi:MAG: phospholipase D-like domain-containing protein [Bdellovibrionales bacterium]|nr:phospholipase D-like domain-containing protein [Bdellovibrionales bacterium]